MKILVKISAVVIFFVFALLAFKFENELNETEYVLQQVTEDQYYDIWQILVDSLERNPTRSEIADYYLENYNQ